MSGSRGQDRDDELADKLACEAIRNVLGAHKLTCDEHENLQQDFKDVALAALRRAKAEVWREAEKLGMEQSPHHTECALKWARECLARAAQIEEGGVMALKEDLWAKVQLHDIDKMDEPRRKKIAEWLREQARTLLREHAQLDKKYRARYWK